MGRKVKISKVEEETRRETMKRGLKHGSIQNGIDKTLNKWGDPVSDKVMGLLTKAHDNAEITKPAVDAFVKSSILAGLSEVIGALGVLSPKIPMLNKVDAGKMEQLEAYTRGYAGQKLGTATADGMFKVAPHFAEMITNPHLKELFNDKVDGDKSKQVEGKRKEKTLFDELMTLSEDD